MRCALTWCTELEWNDSQTLHNTISLYNEMTYKIDIKESLGLWNVNSTVQSFTALVRTLKTEMRSTIAQHANFERTSYNIWIYVSYWPNWMEYKHPVAYGGG